MRDGAGTRSDFKTELLALAAKDCGNHPGNLVGNRMHVAPAVVQDQLAGLPFP
jgi:hypothetical protein